MNILHSFNGYSGPEAPNEAPNIAVETIEGREINLSLFDIELWRHGSKRSIRLILTDQKAKELGLTDKSIYVSDKPKGVADFLNTHIPFEDVGEEEVTKIEAGCVNGKECIYPYCLLNNRPCQRP